MEGHQHRIKHTLFQFAVKAISNFRREKLLFRTFAPGISRFAERETERFLDFWGATRSIRMTLSSRRLLPFTSDILLLVFRNYSKRNETFPSGFATSIDWILQLGETRERERAFLALPEARDASSMKRCKKTFTSTENWEPRGRIRVKNARLGHIPRGIPTDFAEIPFHRRQKFFLFFFCFFF